MELLITKAPFGLAQGRRKEENTKKFFRQDLQDCSDRTKEDK
jgi:hypothetical protein